MRNHIMISMLITVSILITIGYVEHGNAKAIRSKPVQIHKDIPKVNEPLKVSSYDQLLAKYLLVIDQIELKKKQAHNTYYQIQQAERNEKRIDISNRSSEILSALRAESQKSKSKKISLDGGSEGLKALEMTSNESARIFTTLLHEKAITSEDLMPSLHDNDYLLTDGWITLVQEIAANALQNSNIRIHAYGVLYRAGISRSLLRGEIERFAAESPSPWASDTLFYDIDKKTGGHMAVKSSENLELLNKLVASVTGPEVRIECAQYAFDIGQPALAESICSDLLSRQYKGIKNIDQRPTEEDISLARAREGALDLLFYNIKNERAFEKIYSIAHLSETEDKKEGKTPKGYMRPDWYVVVSMEVDKAKSMIQEVLNNGK